MLRHPIFDKQRTIRLCLGLLFNRVIGKAAAAAANIETIHVLKTNTLYQFL